MPANPNRRCIVCGEICPDPDWSTCGATCRQRLSRERRKGTSGEGVTLHVPADVRERMLERCWHGLQHHPIGWSEARWVAFCRGEVTDLDMNEVYFLTQAYPDTCHLLRLPRAV